MILSFHPIFEGDRNITCAGRTPDHQDLAAIRNARAVILSQGCSELLFNMAHENCEHVFPDYSARFQYPGKTGQAALFSSVHAPCPKTISCIDLKSFHMKTGRNQPMPYPFVFKFDWGGEGDFVHFIQSPEAFDQILELTEKYEKSGQKGFLIQEFIPSGNRSLRVVIMHRHLVSYWRVNGRDSFYGNLSKGGTIHHDIDLHLQTAGKEAVKALCDQTGINLAGFDLLLPEKEKCPIPLFLEINYFFGRSGLGGSEPYYRMLNHEIRSWLMDKGIR